ncbi:MAG: endonuclease [Tannerellaceae bacterium]|jgi:endonuclease/exonuclease/phosphatase family metal-dependent hydrolase|nr:endonuclease [Tannerellaceae bacterium]
MRITDFRFPILLVTTLWLLPPLPAPGQIPFRVMSYNVENLFDTYDDAQTEDEDFLPSGPRRWTPSRYGHKLRQLARVISAVGEWDTPALVGLCEAENDTALTHLLTRTPLRQQAYRYLVTQGPDRRGINVALLYQRDKFRYLGHSPVPVPLPSSARPTRPILHVWGRIGSGDTLDVMVCHFPSRYGGEKKSQARREAAAGVLRALSDSLARVRQSPLQIVMGDFNEEPFAPPMRRLAEGSLLNLFADATPSFTRGSYKYRDLWNQLDQILIHRRMQTSDATMRHVPGSARTYAPSFLLINDKVWVGQRPWRSYHGFRHEAGYSDHLPVVADFLIFSD